jgi:hypothetical protein
MSRWTDEELRVLITLWPTHSVLQIAKRLDRQHSAIRSKAERLRLDGRPPHNPEHVDANLPKRRPPRPGRDEKHDGEPWYPGDRVIAIDANGTKKTSV